MPTDRLWKLMDVPHEVWPVGRTLRYQLANTGGLPVVEINSGLYVRESALREWLASRERVRKPKTGEPAGAGA